MQISFAWSWREPINLKAHAMVYELGMKLCIVSGLSRDGSPNVIAQFLGGTGDCLTGLYNFWAEQLSWVRPRDFLKEACLTALYNF